MEADKIPPCEYHHESKVTEAAYCRSFAKGAGCKYYKDGYCMEPKEDVRT